MDEREAELIRRARMGHEDAFTALLEPVLQVALRLSYGMLQRRCDAEDCVQEAAWRSWDRLHNLKPDRPFGNWFLGIVANQCREVRRGRWRSVTWLSDQHPASECDWLEGADLRRALAELRHGDRVVIVMRFYIGLSEREIAAALGLRVSGVGARVNRALKRLRRTLGEG